MSIQTFKTIEDFLNSLDDSMRAQVIMLHEIILSVNPSITATIKWNALNYVFQGEDRITFNVRNKEGLVKLVIHTGAVRPEDKNGKQIMLDESNIVTWVSDSRGVITFLDKDDVLQKQKDLRTVLMRWLDLSLN